MECIVENLRVICWVPYLIWKTRLVIGVLSWFHFSWTSYSFSYPKGVFLLACRSFCFIGFHVLCLTSCMGGSSSPPLDATRWHNISKDNILAHVGSLLIEFGTLAVGSSHLHRRVPDSMSAFGRRCIPAMCRRSCSEPPTIPSMFSQARCMLFLGLFCFVWI